MCVKSFQSGPTLFNLTDSSPPGSSVHGILQARILEWLSCPPPGGLPDPGLEPQSLPSPALAGEQHRGSWEAHLSHVIHQTKLQLDTRVGYKISILSYLRSISDTTREMRPRHTGDHPPPLSKSS